MIVDAVKPIHIDPGLKIGEVEVRSEHSRWVVRDGSFYEKTFKHPGESQGVGRAGESSRTRKQQSLSFQSRGSKKQLDLEHILEEGLG